MFSLLTYQLARINTIFSLILNAVLDQRPELNQVERGNRQQTQIEPREKIESLAAAAAAANIHGDG
jgi:hypothetical protein